MERFWKGAAYGLGALLLAFVVLVAYPRMAPPTPSLGSFLAILKLVGQMLLFGVAVVVVFRLLSRVPKLYLWVLACTLAFLYYHFGGFEPWGQFWMALFVVVPATILGGALAVALSTGGLVARLAVISSLGALVYGLVFFFRPGFAVEPPVNVVDRSASNVVPIGSPNPGREGSHRVETLTYGSGRDRHRPEFGAEVDLVTDSVDGSAFLDGWEGRSGWARTEYWGFDETALPLQGRVWYPTGGGPFALVLIVHGNHSMEDFSDAGYAYLGELFASRGIIFVSVDENFINSSFSSRLDELRGRGLKTENDARGWLLLKHLETWRRFNAEEGNPFFDKVDLDRIGLIGHSRGGEAVAVAHAFNRLERYPDDASESFDFDFDIRGVAAIAPVDGQYKPGGRGTPLVDANYFVLHGSHDGDVQSFAGSRQFERARMSGESFRFKSSLYVFGANHGQFNTTWGRSDSSVPGKNILNLTPIMPENDQRDVARVYLSAFFEVALNDDASYLPLFSDPRTGREWLPDTIYAAHYEDSTHRVIADFEEDLDVFTTSMPGGVVEGENLSDWSESVVSLKRDDKGTSAVVVGWIEEVEPRERTPLYRLSLPPGVELTNDDAFVFTLADGGEPTRPEPEDVEGGSELAEESNEPSEPDETSEPAEPESGPIDFTLEAEDVHGTVARLPLSHFSPLQRALEVQVRKSDLFNRTETSEPVFRSFTFALRDFIEVDSKLDVPRLVEMRFVFDRSPSGKLLLDNIAFRSQGEPALPDD